MNKTVGVCAVWHLYDVNDLGDKVLIISICLNVLFSAFRNGKPIADRVSYAFRVSRELQRDIRKHE
jgi:hypothetical protein